jgi:hypothetical protein
VATMRGLPVGPKWREPDFGQWRAISVTAY